MGPAFLLKLSLSTSANDSSSTNNANSSAIRSANVTIHRGAPMSFLFSSALMTNTNLQK